MEEKKYLKWYNKVGYGSGDLAGNVVYAFLSSFVMLYLTNTVGLNPGIIGTLIMVSKLFDGISDMFFGTMIDKTKSKLGKARPWMLYAYIGCAVTLVANFAIPDILGTTAQYAWFFVAYTLLNAVFFTANNIAYASLVTFCTKNSRERVEMGSWRFIFAFSTSLLIQSVTVQFVRAAGGGAAAWRTVAVVYAVIGLIVNTISVFSIKELPEEELKAGKDHTEEKYGLVEAAKLLFSNKYYLMICATYICQQIYSAMLNMGIYYMIYILKNEDLYSVFSWAINIPVIIAMCITPMLVEKMKGLYRMNLAGYILGTAGRVGVIFAGYMGSVPLMLAFTAVAALGMAPWQWLEISRHTSLDNSRTDHSPQTLRIEKMDREFAFSCLPYTASEIENALHHEELPPARRTVLCVYGAVRGVGGIDSWGTDVADEYHVSAEEDIRYSFTIC